MEVRHAVKTKINNYLILTYVYSNFASTLPFKKQGFLSRGIRIPSEPTPELQVLAHSSGCLAGEGNRGFTHIPIRFMGFGV